MCSTRGLLACLALLLLLQPDPARAAEWLAEYLPGKETCEKHQGVTGRELGQAIEVPVDYADPARGTTPLYFWTQKPLDRSYPTIAFLAGGPGVSSHEAELANLPDTVNVLYLDQRGVSCSKPRSRELYRDPDFYSSENTARDLERVREHLGLEKITVYGHSYGTVPATMYASLFPQQTRALVLEGTIHEGGPGLYQSDYRRGLMQAHFDSLAPARREEILRYSRDPRLSPDWYSRINRFMMYLDDPFPFLDGWLEATLHTEGLDPVEALSAFTERVQSESEFGFSLVMHAMIGCRELGMGSPEAAFHSVFDESGRLVSDGYSRPQNELCEELGVATKRRYSAREFPVSVPVTYFQGEYDGATELPGARAHFEAVPRGFAQLLVLERGGHLPNQQLLNEAAQREIFLHAARGEPIPSGALRDFNERSPLKWRLSIKN
ncbi:MAG: alpha/beta hydrolase [Oligoflexia bacterium]|nr:alpha/beta hydrolase [Oligoflexia bacterium]